MYDKTDENLEGRVAAAIEKRVPLAEALIWSIAAGIAHALDSLHQRGMHHGHVSPRNVLLDGNEKPKLNDVLLSKYFLEGVPIAKRKFLEPPTPRELHLLRSGTSELDDFDGANRDVFALGLVLYEAITLESPLLHYSMQQTVDFEQLRNTLKAKQMCYSRQLVQLALDTLTRVDAQRPSAHMLWETAVSQSTLKLRSITF